MATRQIFSRYKKESAKRPSLTAGGEATELHRRWRSDGARRRRKDTPMVSIEVPLHMFNVLAFCRPVLLHVLGIIHPAPE